MQLPIGLISYSEKRQIRVAEAELLGADVEAVYALYEYLITIEREKQADERAAVAKAEADKEIAEIERKQKAHEAFEADWNKKLFEQSADRIDILQREKQIEIQKAIDAGEDWWKVDKYYNNLIAEERQKLADEAERIAEAQANKEIAEAEKVRDARLAFNEEWNRKQFEHALRPDDDDSPEIQLQKRIDILQRQKQVEIQAAIEAGQDWLLVDQHYNNLIQDERDKHYAKIAKLAEEDADRQIADKGRRKKEKP